VLENKICAGSTRRCGGLQACVAARASLGIALDLSACTDQHTQAASPGSCNIRMATRMLPDCMPCVSSSSPWRSAVAMCHQRCPLPCRMRSSSDGGDGSSAHKDFGRVPQYLIQRKMELAEAQAVQQEAKEKAWIPPGGGPDRGTAVAPLSMLLPHYNAPGSSLPAHYLTTRPDARAFPCWPIMACTLSTRQTCVAMPMPATCLHASPAQAWAPTHPPSPPRRHAHPVRGGAAGDAVSAGSQQG
jgi:hypothetical protein